MSATVQGVVWIEATWPAPVAVQALTTTRALLNRALTAAPDPSQPDRLPSSFPRLEHSRLKHLQWLRQVHGNRCIHATVGSSPATPRADAAWTDAANLGLVVLTADCVPIVVTDGRGERIGVAHGGWRGLAEGVVASLIAGMGVSGSLMAWIGPAIGRDAYTVGEDVYETVRSAFGRTLTEAVFSAAPWPGKWHLDLFALSGRLLNAAGVNAVYGDRLCTFSDPRFHSYRRDATTRRMATVVWKKRLPGAAAGTN